VQNQDKIVIQSYKDLIVWQKAMEMVTAIYELTENFPKEEMYGLTSQIRRSAISVASNIAEGRARGSSGEFLQFLKIAYGSGAELETQIEIAKRLKNTKTLDYTTVDSLLLEVMKMLNSLMNKVYTNRKSTT
jgi:four helix bundle protein